MKFKYELRINKLIFAKEEVYDLLEMIISIKDIEPEIVDGRIYLICTAEKILDIKEKLHRFGETIYFLLKGRV